MKQFGCYTIISELNFKLNKNKSKRYFYTCQCKCGFIKDVYTENLYRKPESCYKCVTRTKEIFKYGDIYFNLTFIKYLNIRKKRRFILARCVCKKEIEITSTSWGRSKSCGCYRKLQGSSHWNYNGTNTISGNHLWALKNNAKKRNLKFNLKPDFIDKLFQKQNERCALSGLPIKFGKKTRTASLDRIDSSKDYTKDNVQWVHKDIQRMKSDFDQNYFKLLCKAVDNN